MDAIVSATAWLGIGQERILVNVSMAKVERTTAITSHKERKAKEGR